MTLLGVHRAFAFPARPSPFRTTNLLDRLFGGTPAHEDDPACLWRAGRSEADVCRAHSSGRALARDQVSEFERRRLNAIRAELDGEFRIRIAPVSSAAFTAASTRLSSKTTRLDPKAVAPGNLHAAFCAATALRSGLSQP